MTSLVDTPRSRYQRSPSGSSQHAACTTFATSTTAATPKQPAKLQNPFSGESTCVRQNFPDFSPSVFVHKETPADARSEKKFQWSIDEMANLQPADIDERTAQAFHCTPRRDSAKQVALNKFFLQQNVVASPYVASNLTSGRKHSVKHVTFSPLPPVTKYISRDDDCSSGDSSCESAMDVGDEAKRHSVCTQTSASLMETEDTLPPNCVQMESMAELKDLSYSSLRRKLFGPSEQDPPSGEASPTPDSDARSAGTSSKRFGESEEPAIVPGQFLSMSSEEDSDCEVRMFGRRPSWGRCSSSPTNHLGEECMGLYSSPIGLMEEPVFVPVSDGCADEEEFEQIENLDLSPIAAREPDAILQKENSFAQGAEAKPMTSTLRTDLCNAYPASRDDEMPMEGGSCLGDTADAVPYRYPVTPLGDCTNQPSTLRASQLATLTSSASYEECIVQDVPMSHGKCAEYIYSRVPREGLPLVSSSADAKCSISHLSDEYVGQQASTYRDYHSWSYQGGTPVRRSQPSKTTAAFDDWQRSVDSWQHSIQQQLAEFDENRTMLDH